MSKEKSMLVEEILVDEAVVAEILSESEKPAKVMTKGDFQAWLFQA